VYEVEADSALNNPDYTQLVENKIYTVLVNQQS